MIWDKQMTYGILIYCSLGESKMVVYQKFGVIGSSFVFAILQKLKLQIFRLFIAYDTCRRTGSCENSTEPLNATDTSYEEDFVFRCLIVNNVLSVIPCIFLASWSDRHGRKALLSLPFVGSFIGDILMLVLLCVPTASKNILLISEGVHGFCGGTVLIGLGCMSYLTDATDHRLRTWFIGLFIGVMNFVPVIEMTFQFYYTPLATHQNSQTLILIGICIRTFLTAYFLVYIKVFVMESVFVLGSFHGNPWTNLLTPINVSDTVNCVFKRRLDNLRFFIIALCTVFIFYGFVFYGNLAVRSRHFQWPLLFSAIHALLQTLTLWTSIRCRVPDIELGVYGGLSLAASCFALTFIRNNWLGTLVGLASLLIPSAAISVLSKLIERVETGSMFAGIGFLTLVTQLTSVPSYRGLYQVCAEAGMPQVTFLLSFGLATLGMLFWIYLKRHIAPDLLGHLNGRESLALISRKTFC